MKAKNWLTLLWFGLFAAGIAAQPRPYQLCRGVGTSNQQLIQTNYRYPPKPEQRTVVGLNRFECTSAYPLVDCYHDLKACKPVNSMTDQCGESNDSWYDILVMRSADLDAQALPMYLPWPSNPAVQTVVAFPYISLIETYRTWPYATPLAPEPQFLESRNVQFHSPFSMPECHTMAHLLGFFNGVWNTKKEAERSLEVMKQQSFLGPDWRGAPIRYELFYNQSCKSVAGGACLQDVAEVFRQRSTEIDGLLDRRWEYFWEQVTGQHIQAGSFTQRLADRVVRADNALAQWFDTLGNAVLAKITALSTMLLENPPTAQDTAGHTAQLVRTGQRAERAVLVAHSQGNLFVSAAYDAYLAHSRQAGALVGEDTGYVAAKVVHIAPASPTLRGPYVLASTDLVINGLRRVDGTYLPVSNATLPLNSKDLSGHKLLDTYLDEARPLRAQIRQLVTDALDAL
jgi:hypothetical protein